MFYHIIYKVCFLQVDDISVVKKGNHVRLKNCLHEQYLVIKGKMIFLNYGDIFKLSMTDIETFNQTSPMLAFCIFRAIQN